MVRVSKKVSELLHHKGSIYKTICAHHTLPCTVCPLISLYLTEPTWVDRVMLLLDFRVCSTKDLKNVISFNVTFL